MHIQFRKGVVAGYRWRTSMTERLYYRHSIRHEKKERFIISILVIGFAVYMQFITELRREESRAATLARLEAESVEQTNR